MTIARNTLLLVLLLAFPPGVARAQLMQKSAANPIVRTFEPIVRMTLAAEPCVLTDSVTGLRRMWFSASGAAVARLASYYRLVVELRHYQELSYDEIAGELKIPLSDVKSHLFRARKLLAEKLHAPD